jgi:hypothetical protein
VDVEVTVWLVEELTGGSTSPLVDRDGLASFDAAVNPTDLPTDPAVPVDAAIAPAFDDPNVSDVTAVYAVGYRDWIVNTTGAPADEVTLELRRIELATFTLRSGSAPGQTTLFEVTDYDDPGAAGDEENTFYWDDFAGAQPLDGLIADGSFAIETVPEPTGLSLLGLGGLAMLRRRRTG